MFSSGMPSWSDAIIEKLVAWPWPCADVPDRTVAVPSACTSTWPYSLPPNPVISTYVASPMPSSLVSPASIRRRCSARAPSTSAIRSASRSGRS